LETVSSSPFAASFWRLVNADTKSRLGDALAGLQKIIDYARESGMDSDRRIALIKDLSDRLFQRD
ncbi:MAG: hypothetical protein K2H64_10040, partial [Desulfovibrio sp.]|nr:hypothetical protein [Desulfovibrio sp.]